MTNEIEKSQGAISISEIKEIKHATAEEVMQVNDGVLELDCSLHKANEELKVLNSNLDVLEATLNRHTSIVSEARSKMHRILPKL